MGAATATQHTHEAEVVDPAKPTKPKKAKRVSARAPKPIGKCDTCPRPFFKEEDKVYVPLTETVICKTCSEMGKAWFGTAVRAVGELVAKARGR